MTTDNSTKTKNEEAIAKTVLWIERVVIGLNLCPFAKAIHAKNQIRYEVSNACESRTLLADLKRELSLLVETAPNQIESTFLILSDGLSEFTQYNHFLDLCTLLLEEMQLDGVIQIASFHPHYQFENTNHDDVTNYTNRSPFPMLHLLREESVTRAIEAFPDSNNIYDRNIATMRSIGKTKMDAFLVESKVESPELEKE
jgi:hypothetical protein